MCGKKKLSKLEAEWIITKNKAREHTDKRFECRIYFCDQCQAWHLTSKSKREYYDKKPKPVPPPPPPPKIIGPCILHDALGRLIELKE